MRRGSLLIMTGVGLALAVPAALPEIIVRHQGEVHFFEWFLAAGCAAAASVLLFWQVRNVSGGQLPEWTVWMSAGSLAALAPLAVSATRYTLRADVALLAATAAVACALSDRRQWARGGAVVLTALACAMEGTALLLPAGWLWASLARRKDVGWSVVLLAAGGVGVAISLAAGWPVLARYPLQETVFNQHRDLLLLLPVVLLGMGGWARGRFERTQAWWLPGWLGASLGGLAAIVLGGVIHVRLAVLAFWWLMPAGLAELATMLRTDVRRDRTMRILGVLVVLTVAMLAWAGFRRWGDGMLMILYLITEGG